MISTFKIIVEGDQLSVIKDAITLYSDITDKKWGCLLNHPTYNKVLISKYEDIDIRNVVIDSFISDMNRITDNITYIKYDYFNDFSKFCRYLSDNVIEITVNSDECSLLSNCLYLYTRIGYGDWDCLIESVYLPIKDYDKSNVNWDERWESIKDMYSIRDRIIGIDLGWGGTFSSVINVDDSCDVSYEIFSAIMGDF